jgi:ligand-binding SRPBCC domain-containing protein
VPRIEVVERVHAPVERVFDLARSIDLHIRSERGRGEEAIAGRTSGLMELGETTTFRAKHLGIRRCLTSKMVALDRPRHFRDSMVAGTFARFDHDHFFEADGEFTIMRDVFDYTSPLGVLGRLADTLFLRNYMKALVEERIYWIKRVAECEDEWRQYLTEP